MSDDYVDFPAAHSMDTAWFGVDDNGEIAVFETGEGGSVPTVGGCDAENIVWQDMFGGCPIDEKNILQIPVDGAPLAALCVGQSLEANLKAWLELEYFENLIVVYSNEEAVPNFPKIEYGAALRFAGADVVVMYPDLDPLEDDDAEAFVKNIESGVASGGIIGLGPVYGDVSGFDEMAAAQGLSREQLIETLDEYARSYVDETVEKGNDDWFKKFIGVHVYQADEEAGFYEAAKLPYLQEKHLLTAQKKLVSSN